MAVTLDTTTPWTAPDALLPTTAIRPRAVASEEAPHAVAPSSRSDVPRGQAGSVVGESQPLTIRRIEGRQERPEGIQQLNEDRMKKRIGLEPCSTCANRRYQDESGDGSVSFQSPTPIAPEAAASAVRAHEYEHVRNEQTYARQEGRRVVSQSVRIFTAICPECGRTYVSGGETRTTTASQVPSTTPEPTATPFELVA